MVRTVKTTKNEKNPISKQTFLHSLLHSYPEGIHCSVNSVSSVFPNHYRNNCPSLFVNISIDENMNKCLGFELDESGNYVKEIDPLGKEVKKIITVDGTGKIVNFNFDMKYPKDLDYDIDDEEYFISVWSSFYPLLHFGLVQNGIIEKENKDNLIVTYDDILDGLENLEFIATAKQIKNGDFNYTVLKPKSVVQVVE